MTSDDGRLLGGKRLVEAATERAKRRGHFRQEGERRAPEEKALGRDWDEGTRRAPRRASPALQPRKLQNTVGGQEPRTRRSGMKWSSPLQQPTPPRSDPIQWLRPHPPHQPVVSPPYFQFTSQAGEKRITSLWVFLRSIQLRKAISQSQGG